MKYLFSRLKLMFLKEIIKDGIKFCDPYKKKGTDIFIRTYWIDNTRFRIELCVNDKVESGSTTNRLIYESKSKTELTAFRTMIASLLSGEINEILKLRKLYYR